MCWQANTTENETEKMYSSFLQQLFVCLMLSLSHAPYLPLPPSLSLSHAPYLPLSLSLSLSLSVSLSLSQSPHAHIPQDISIFRSEKRDNNEISEATTSLSYITTPNASLTFYLLLLLFYSPP